MGNIELSKTSGAEFISHQLFEYVVNPNPMTAWVNGFCDYLNMQQVNNIIDVLNDLKRVKDLIEEKTGRNLYFDTIVFQEDILPILQKAKDTVNEQKRKLYVSFMAACIHPDSLNCNNKSIYMSLLDQLDYLSIYILKQLDHYTTEKKLVEKFGQSYDKEVILVHLWGLQPCGLIEKNSAKEIESLYKSRGNIRMRHPEGAFLYRRTDLGNSFLSFIIKGMPEDNSNNKTF